MTTGVENHNICIGTGLVALDVILNGKPETLPKLTAGGSCGNVMTILSFLGWSTYPIARFGQNKASAEVETDLKRWKVSTDLITKTPDGSTPIIIHRILKDKNGNPKHRFEFRDPETKKWLPQYKPVLSKEVPNIVQTKSLKSNVFYFDRINRASIDLAKFYKNQGALVFFEPSSVGNNPKMFEECLAVSDIIKYSSERIKDYSILFPVQKVPLEIETLGSMGIKFRFSINKKTQNWQHLSGYKINDVVDSAGAGDWCTSGIIYSLIGKNKGSLKTITVKDIKTSLEFGQSLGALNCCFDGARGLMYNLTKKQIINATNQSASNGLIDISKIKKSPILFGKKMNFKELLSSK